MPNANPENLLLQEILNRLATLDGKVDKEFNAATDDRQAIRNELQQVSSSLEAFRKKKTAENFADAGRGLREVGISLSMKKLQVAIKSFKSSNSKPKPSSRNRATSKMRC